MWNVDVFTSALNVQSFVVTGGTGRGFLHMYGSYNTVDSAEGDLP